MKISSLQLLEYIANNSDSKSYVLGKKLFEQGKVIQCKYDEKNKEFQSIIQIKSKFIDTNLVFDKNRIVETCSCSNTSDLLCEHLVASCLAINEKFATTKVGKKSNEHIIEDFELSKAFLWPFYTSVLQKKVKSLEYLASINLEKSNGVFEAEVVEAETTNKVLLQKPKYTPDLHASCTCGYKSSELCAHSLFTLNYILKTYGKTAFEQTYNWNLEKEELLNKYGLSLLDNWQDKLEFQFIDGKVKLKVIDSRALQLLVLQKTHFQPISNETQTKQPKYTLAVVFNELYGMHFPVFQFDIISGTYYEKTENFQGHIVKLRLDTFVNQLPNKEIAEIVKTHILFDSKYSISAIGETFKEFSKIAHSEAFPRLPVRNLDIPYIYNFAINYLPDFQNLIEQLKNNLVFRTRKGENVEKYTVENITKTFFAETKISGYFQYLEKDNTIELKPIFLVENQKYELGNLNPTNIWYTEVNDKLCVSKDAQTCVVLLLTFFQKKEVLTFNRQTFPVFIQQFIQEYKLKIKGIKEDDLLIDNQFFEPIGKIRLAETGNFLLFYPTVKYGDSEVLVNRDKESFNYTPGGGYSRVIRDKNYEDEFKKHISSLHKNFNPNTLQEYYTLPSNEAMRRTWFIEFYHKCKEKGIEVYGFNKLKQFKFNTSRPNFSYSLSSGIDWFDLKMDIKFGNQSVQLIDVRRALLKQENIVLLEDGSLGMLPDEWLEKWSYLFKLGTVNEDNIRISNIHYTLLEKANEDIDNKVFTQEVLDRKAFIEKLRKEEDVKVSPQIKVELRDYQIDGLKWLVSMTQLGWGGCLADDMGLGKTLQVLALFCHLSDKDKEQRNKYIVISPTTLIFNWQSEISKFCPHFRTYIYHGTSRKMNQEIFDNHDIFLTSYGTMVNNVEIFKDIVFTCIVLDESQSIKNVNSLRYKSVNQLQARNKFVLTGTPIENNTLELYAQMNFANNGLLGSYTFFKTEFFEAIDKRHDNKKAEELVQLIRPFMKRRTKEEVAKDLPEKTEMVLYCEMAEEQRSVYDSFRIEIRKQLLSKIDADGLNKSKMSIMESLMKLRQICDSPALLKTSLDVGNSSAKCDELFRHIVSKTGKHKILIFSQFLGMLKIICERLDFEKIKYAYLDGSTTNRKEVVNEFKQNEDCRIFVISLKAGGFGLNLTEADYVYLVDPWWNPAVEEQAIDRTHRIGQKNKVFAYRMICKDTIEEKIIELQQRKKDLADKIISDESSFVKDLSREDLEILLS